MSSEEQNIYYSYKYVFFELLKFIEEVEIIYRHQAFATSYFCDWTDDVQLDGKSKWSISLIKMCGYYKSEAEKLRNDLRNIINQKKKYVKDHRLELRIFYSYFLERLEKNKSRLGKLRNGEIQIEEMANNGALILEYLGAFPFSEEHELHAKNVSEPPEPAIHNEDSYTELHREIKKNLDIIIKELESLILFLKHEQNLYEFQDRQLKKGKGKSEFVNLIKKGEIKRLFDKLDSIDEYSLNEDIILLSSRYYSLENEKQKGMIDRNDYNIQSSNLLSSLLTAILNK
jgi:hypothetical protein